MKKVSGYLFDPDIQELLYKVVDFYSRLRASDLVNLSHVVGGPWYSVWHHNSTINAGMKIDDEEIATFYSKAPPPFPIQ